MAFFCGNYDFHSRQLLLSSLDNGGGRTLFYYPKKSPFCKKKGNPFSSSGRKNHEKAAPAILRPFFEEKLIFGLMCHRWWAWPPNPFWAVRIYFLPPSLPLLHNLPMWKTSFCYYTLKPCFIIVQGVPFQNSHIEIAIWTSIFSKVFKN